jgi:hypothetical protein
MITGSAQTPNLFRFRWRFRASGCNAPPYDRHLYAKRLRRASSARSDLLGRVELGEHRDELGGLTPLLLPARIGRELVDGPANSSLRTIW